MKCDESVSGETQSLAQVLLENAFESLAPISKRHQCPCCGGLTLNEPAAYKLCRLCHWIDDGRDKGAEEEVRGHHNSDYSLSEARRNFEEFRIMCRPGRHQEVLHEAELSESVVKIKNQLLSAFEHWIRASAQERPAIEKVIAAYESDLHDEFREQPVPISERHQCPCCGYPTLDEVAIYDLCLLCFWEDDGQDDDTADDVRYGPNSDYSLSEARRNFKEFRIMFRPGDRLFKQSERKLKIKGLWISAFERWIQAPEELRPLIEEEIISYENALEKCT